MVSAHKVIEDVAPRRPASVAALDARLSVWGQATRDAAQARARALAQGAGLLAGRLGRSTEALEAPEVNAAEALLALDTEPLARLAASVLPAAIPHASRILWVDPERLEERLVSDLAPTVEAARNIVRRRQALYRRRARLWRDLPDRLEWLRDEVEALRVPKCPSPRDVADALDRLRARAHVELVRVPRLVAV
ncbi:MAG: hypothetical protein HYV07_10975 [Deltaproteobacteria bacterium]|nr:hypothetical protein [Deltaproteobacteria bacterium]